MNNYNFIHVREKLVRLYLYIPTVPCTTALRIFSDIHIP